MQIFIAVGLLKSKQKRHSLQMLRPLFFPETERYRAVKFSVAKGRRREEICSTSKRSSIYLPTCVSSSLCPLRNHSLSRNENVIERDSRTRLRSVRAVESREWYCTGGNARRGGAPCVYIRTYVCMYVPTHRQCPQARRKGLLLIDDTRVSSGRR